MNPLTTPITGRSRLTARVLVPGLVAAALLGVGGVATAKPSLAGAAPAGGGTSVTTPVKQADDTIRGTRAAHFDRLTAVAEAQGTVDVTITLADAPTRAPDAGVRQHLAEQSKAGRAAALRALDGAAGTSITAGAPMMGANVTAADLGDLRKEKAILAIAETQVYETAGTSTFGSASGVQLKRWWHQNRIGLDWTYANGYNGSGQKVVVIDSGVDATHPWLSGRVVDGACFSQTGCTNGQTVQYGVSAGMPCTYSYGCAHGTHVAHIAAGQYGAARSAGIVAINAASRGVDKYGNPAPRFNDYDLINALWYSYNYVSPAPAAVNMSLGSDRTYASTCDSLNSSVSGWISSLRSRGTATVIAAGNGNSATGVGYPACISTAVVVGNATQNSSGVLSVLGGVTGGSNSSSLVDLWAPGTDICSAVPTNLDSDGVPDGVDCSYYGTSMAAPQVAGAFAVLKAARSTYTVNQSLAALQRQGVALTDTRNNVTRSSIRISNAVYYGF